jgi:hypothetical protein
LSLLLSLLALSVWAQPTQIILLRHGEKPEDPSAPHLSPRGEDRARALVTLLGRNSRLTSNAPIAALFATHVTKHDRSHRTGETLAPLAHELGLVVEEPFDSDNFGPLARRILTDRKLQGKTVVVCWTHHRLSQLAGALGVRPEPPPWKEKVFDRLWVLEYDHGRVSLRDLPQHLLKGDAKH